MILYTKCILYDIFQVTKLLVEAIFARGMTVRESKSIVQKELKLNCDMDVSLDRCVECNVMLIGLDENIVDPEM